MPQKLPQVLYRVTPALVATTNTLKCGRRDLRMTGASLPLMAQSLDFRELRTSAAKATAICWLPSSHAVWCTGSKFSTKCCAYSQLA